jgi:hypothetical protein
MVPCDSSERKLIMSNTECKLQEADLQVSYSDTALKKAYSKYSFHFKIDGDACRTWFDPEKDLAFFDCGDTGEQLYELSREIERVIEECVSKTSIDILDLRKFALKHIQAMIRVEKELQKAPASERRWEVVKSKPIDLDKLSLENNPFGRRSKSKSKNRRPSLTRTGLVT